MLSIFSLLPAVIFSLAHATASTILSLLEIFGQLSALHLFPYFLQHKGKEVSCSFYGPLNQHLPTVWEPLVKEIWICLWTWDRSLDAHLKIQWQQYKYHKLVMEKFVRYTWIRKLSKLLLLLFTLADFKLSISDPEPFPEWHTRTVPFHFSLVWDQMDSGCSKES